MATHPIKYFLLNKQELQYEILIRGEEPASTVLALRRQITKLINNIPSDDLYESGLDASVDCDGVQESLAELALRINNLAEKIENNLYERTMALHNHLYHRIRRIDRTNSAVGSFRHFM